MITLASPTYLCSRAENINVSALFALHLLLLLSSMFLLFLISGKMTLSQKKSLVYILKEHVECFEGDLQINVFKEETKRYLKQKEENDS